MCLTKHKNFLYLSYPHTVKKNVSFTTNHTSLDLEKVRTAGSCNWASVALDLHRQWLKLVFGVAEIDSMNS